jgi:hypothetical protein
VSNELRLEEVGRHLTDAMTFIAGLRYSQYSSHTVNRESGDLVGGSIDRNVDSARGAARPIPGRASVPGPDDQQLGLVVDL